MLFFSKLEPVLLKIKIGCCTVVNVIFITEYFKNTKQLFHQ